MDECEAAILAMKPPGEMVVGRVRKADRFGVSWRQMNDHTIAISRRSEVAKLDEVIGPKY